MVLFPYDNFDDGVLDPRWILEWGLPGIWGTGTYDERTGRGRFTLIQQHQNGILWTYAKGYYDAWLRIEMPSTKTEDGGGGLYLWDSPYEDGFVGLELVYDGSGPSGAGYYVKGWMENTVESESEVTVIKKSHDLPYVYFRIKYKSGDHIRMYYMEVPGEGWTEFTPTMTNYWAPAETLDLELHLSMQSHQIDSNPRYYYIDYLLPWPPLDRVRSRQVKLDGIVPTQVSDLKDGEMRVTDTDMYARVGDQILSMAFTTSLSFTTTTTTTTTT